MDKKMSLILKLPEGLQRRVVSLMAKREGGEWLSKTLRSYYKEQFNIEVGKASYGCFFGCRLARDSSIGNYCSVAKGVQTFNGNHPFNESVMHPIFYGKQFGGSVEDIPRGQLKVGHDVWIGSNVIVLPNCQTIGNGAVIGAGSVVTKSIEPYVIVAGNPAKVIGHRFEDDEIAALETSKWWELDPKALLAFYPYRKTPKVFAEKIMEQRAVYKKI